MLLTGSMNLTNRGVDSNVETCSLVAQGPMLVDSMSRWMRVVELRLTLVSSQIPTRPRKQPDKYEQAQNSTVLAVMQTLALLPSVIEQWQK